MTAQAHPGNSDPAAPAAEVLSLRADRRAARDDLTRLRRAVWAAIDLIDEALKCPDKLGRERRVLDARDGLERAAVERPETGD